jgi:hypothetical protein
VLAVFLASGHFTIAAETNWYTGAAFQRALQHPVGLTWSETELRPALMQLSRVQRVAIFLDRRVDPHQLVEFRSGEAPLREVLRRLAASLDLGTTELGSVLYMGPPDTAAVLDATADLRLTEAKGLSVAARERYLAMEATYWPQLAEPRELLQALTSRQQIEVVGLDAVPHDLWPEVDLPPMTLIHRVTLILAGFDLTFHLEAGGREMHLENLSHDILVERTYRHSLSSPELKKLAEQFADSSIQFARGRIVLRGAPEAHRRMLSLLDTEPAPTATTGFDPNTVYTLTITNQPVGAVIKTLQQRGLKFNIAPSMTERLYMRVSFRVREAPLDKLLAATLTPAGLTFERQGNVITLRKGE